MLSASAFLRAISGDPSSGVAGLMSGRFFYGLRLLGAIALATLVPLLIDRHARRSSRVGK
jgi:hypothetical protein